MYNPVIVEENWLMVFAKEHMMGNYMGLFLGMFILIYIVELAKIFMEYIGILYFLDEASIWRWSYESYPLPNGDNHGDFMGFHDGDI